MRHASALAVLLVLIWGGGIAVAYDPDTHRALATKSASAKVSALDQLLRLELGLTDGIGTQFPGVTFAARRQVDQLIGDGAFSEDVPRHRSLNHFHNPLIDPWDNAGLQAFSILGFATVRGQSSVLWQQNEAQDTSSVFIFPLPLASGGGNWSWRDARQRYLAALTRPRKEDAETEPGRDRAFGELFENLGHLTHLVQDAFVPAHARNDAHPPRVRPDWYEKWVENERVKEVPPGQPGLFTSLLNEKPKGPDSAIFTPTGNTRAPVPVARLIDTDTFSPLNAGVLGEENPLIGAAEYTNGNFLSRGTLFRAFALPRPTALDPGEIIEESPRQFRRYFTKSRDGATIPRFVTEGMLFDSLDAAQAAPMPSAGWMFDDRVHEDYAGALLPRAVGYSAALLDYFFRGRLEFELLPGDGDASQAKLVGFNRSEDLLGVGGQLSLYWEDVAGQRQAVEGLAPTLAAAAGKNDALPELTFRWPRGAQRFVLAYRGPLGLEADAVVGKVVESPALEQIYWQAILAGPQYVFPWFLRTAEGIFLLPFEDFLGQSAQDVRWGERDHALVVQTSQGDDLLTGTSFIVFTLDRPEGSRAVPTTGEVRFGRPVVRLQQGASVALSAPAGLDLGTTVTVTHRHVLRQTLFTFDRVTTYRWNEAVQGYVFDKVTASGEGMAGLAPYDETYQRSFALRLDGAHFRHDCGELSCEFYSWSWEDFTLTAAGDVLLLVRVTEGFLPGTQREVPEWGHVGAGDDPVIISSLPFDFGFPSDSPSPNELEKVRFLAWVNLTQGTVVAKSMGDAVTLSQETVFDALREEQRDVTEMTGGPSDSRTVGHWTPFFSSRCTDARESLHVQLERGPRSLGYAGLYRSEFAVLALETDFAVTSPTVVTQQCYSADDLGIGKAYGLTTTSRELSTFPYGITTFDFDVKLVLPGTPALERFPLVFTRRSDEERQLVLWNALAGTAQRLLQESAPGFPAMATANQRWALLDDFPRVHLVALDGSGTFDFPWEDRFGRQFVDVYTLVPPDRLYNALDGTFYTVVGPGDLRPTQMPDSLAPVDAADQAWVNAPRWPYHLVRPR